MGVDALRAPKGTLGRKHHQNFVLRPFFLGQRLSHHQGGFKKSGGTPSIRTPPTTSYYKLAVDLGSRVIMPNNTLYTLQAGSFKLSLISYCFAVYTRLTGSPLSNHGLDPLLRDVEMQRARGDDMRRTRG